MIIKCQNCGCELAQKDNENIIFKPSEIQSMAQELSKNLTLITLQCPKCGCTLQIKS